MRTTLLPLILAAIACNKGEWQDTSMCLDVADDATSCPAAADISKNDLVSYGWCEADVRSIEGEGVLSDAPFLGDSASADVVCCYPVIARDAATNCAIGRPYQQGPCTIEAAVRPGDGWSAPGQPATTGIDWLAMARMEHASVAAFARLTLDLLALGAPASLVAQVQAAAADEVEHARLCFGLHGASADPVEPGPMDIGPVRPSTPEALAYAAVREGCLGETMGAWLLGSLASDQPPEVSGVLSRIAADEARHAALSWAIVRWLLDTHDVGDAVERAFAEPFGVALPEGFTDDTGLAELIQAGSQQVLEPARRALLGSLGR